METEIINQNGRQMDIEHQKTIHLISIAEDILNRSKLVPHIDSIYSYLDVNDIVVEPKDVGHYEDVFRSIFHSVYDANSLFQSVVLWAESIKGAQSMLVSFEGLCADPVFLRTNIEQLNNSPLFQKQLHKINASLYSIVSSRRLILELVIK